STRGLRWPGSIRVHLDGMALYERVHVKSRQRVLAVSLAMVASPLIYFTVSASPVEALAVKLGVALKSPWSVYLPALFKAVVKCACLVRPSSLAVPRMVSPDLNVTLPAMFPKAGTTVAVKEKLLPGVTGLTD